MVFVSFEFGEGSKGVWEQDGWGMSEIGEGVDGGNKMGIVSGEGKLIVIDDDKGEVNLDLNGGVNVGWEKEIVINGDGDIKICCGDWVIVNSGENGGVMNIFELREKLKERIKEVEEVGSMLNCDVE